MKIQTKYTIVQHSGFGYNENPQFEKAVETRQAITPGEINRIKLAHGVIFDSYLEAEDFAEKANYPEDNRSIIPSVKGTFSKRRIDGLRIYIPVRNIVA